MAGSQVCNMSGLQRVGHVVPLRGIFGVIKNRAGIRAAFRIRNPQSRPALEDVGPCRSRLNNFFKQALSYLLFDEVLQPG